MPANAVSELIARYQIDRLEDHHKIDLAKAMLDRIVEMEVSPDPIHYLVIYEAIQEIDPALSKRIKHAIDSNYYSDAIADDFFSELIAQYLFEHLPTQQVEELLSGLLLQIEHWTQSSIQNQKLINNSFAEIIPNLPTSVKSTVETEILPALKNLFEDTEKLSHEVNEATGEIQHLKTELEQAYTIAKTDDLTGLPNRRAFNETSEEMLAESQNSNFLFSMLIIDIDYFKKINDEFGHLTGDSALRYLAKQLKREIKGKDFIARMGGEEFVILLANTDHQNALNVAKNLRKKIESIKLQVTKQNKTLQMTISCGVATVNAQDDIDSLLQRADQSLYLAKHSGRNQVKGELDLKP